MGVTRMTAEITQFVSPAPDSLPSELTALAILRTDAVRVELADALRRCKGVTLDIVAVPPTGIAICNLIFAEVNPDDTADLAKLAELKAVYGERNCAVVAVTEAVSPQSVIRAIRAGARDVLMRPVHHDEINALIERARQDMGEACPSQGGLGRILTFAHVAGGSGATTLAVNAAGSITRACQGSDVCIIDLDVQFGSVASLLDMPAASPLDGLVADPGRLDREMLENMMMRHPSGVHVLTAPRLPMPLEALNASLISDILDIARRHYRYVIVDLPHSLTSWSEVVFRKSSVIYVVTQVTIPAVHQLKKFFDLLREENLDDMPFKVVVNRHQGAFAKTSDISIAQVEHAIGRSVDFRVPNDYELVSGSLNHGKPVINASKTSKFSVALEGMLRDSLFRNGVSQPPVKQARSLLPRLRFGG